MNCEYLTQLGFTQYNMGVLFDKDIGEGTTLRYDIGSGRVWVNDTRLPRKYYARDDFDKLYRVLAGDGTGGTGTTE